MEAYKNVVSGFPLLDERLEGVRGINVVGGAPKAGKSTWLIQIATELTRRRVPVLYYDFENGRQRIYQRTVSRLARLEVAQLSGTSLTEEEAIRLAEAKKTLQDMLHYLRVVSDRGITPELMKKHIEFLRHETRSDYVVVAIDSLHKLPFKEFGEKRAGIDGWLREFEAMRDGLGVSFIVISELSRQENGSYDGVPHMGVFKGSGDIEYSADNAMVLMPSNNGGGRYNTLWLVASREHAPGQVAQYKLDYPFWGFREEPVPSDDAA
nr:DnaB-like helicase C-terminal domain-containing protein [Desulforhopalus vacuolatus]